MCTHMILNVILVGLHKCYIFDETVEIEIGSVKICQEFTQQYSCKGHYYPCLMMLTDHILVSL